VGAVALPFRADAQQVAFLEAFSELTAALEGTFGDEGAGVASALDAMSTALEAWDREIAAAESGLRAAARNAAPSDLLERRVSLGRMYVGRGRLADALSEFDAASRLAPERADLHVLRGLVLRAMGKPENTLEAFRTARSLDPGSLVAAYYLFHEALVTGSATDVREASEALSAAYPQFLDVKRPNKGTPFIRLAGAHDAAGGPPLLPPAAYGQAFRHLSRGDYDTAIAEFRRAAAVDPLVADPAAGTELMMRAVGALRQGRLSEAQSLLEQSGPPGNSSEAHRVLGLVYWTASEYDKAIASLTAAVRLSPRDERARLALARVLSAAGRDAEAERALEGTLRALPDSVLARWWLALAHQRVNRLVDARQQIERVVNAALSGESQLHAAIGRLALNAADAPGAIAAFTRAVRATPNDPAMHRSLAGALLQQDRTGEAFAEFVAALLIDPQDAAAHAGIGRIHLDAGREADAADALRRATNLAPEDSEARYALASALERLGRTEDAAQHFARVAEAQRQMLADRRRALSADVLQEEAALRVTEGRLETAIALYEEALAAGAAPAVYGRLADLYAKVGRALDAGRARAMYEKALLDDRANGSLAQ
jgi:tetratricopeptide (TPR) repeat protein